MTGLLASVMTAAEAEAALAGGADIIDLKDPRRGALGALPAAVIGEAVARIDGRRPVSATAGDLPMEPAVVAEAAARIADLGVDCVKVGIFPADDLGGDRNGCLDRLSRLAAHGVRLVAVMFADQAPDLTLIPRLQACGFAGAMLDTADKTAGGLRAHLGEPVLRSFVEQSRAFGLLTGLAGSLAREDIAPLLRLAPDYLGFRGALTQGGRTAGLDPLALAAVRAAIPQAEPYQPAAASKATAAAGAQQAAQSLASAGPSISSAKST